MQCLFKDNPFIYFRLLETFEKDYLSKLVLLDTTHITINSGNKKFIVVTFDHFAHLIKIGVLTKETSNSLINFIECEILMIQRILLKI